MTESSTPPIYLDYNATTPILPEVVEEMLPYLRGGFGNPSSSHVYGREARRAVDRARRQVAGLIGASPSEVIFTSGGTESNNLAIVGAMKAHSVGSAVVTSVIEHPSVVQPCRHVEGCGGDVIEIGVDETGRVDVDELDAAVGPDTGLVTIMHSNNETGVVQPIDEIVGAARSCGALIHTDAAQSIGKVAVDVEELGVDLLSIAGHKVYAPKGVGALYVASGVDVEPVLRGAGHERGLRPGTENVAAIVGLGKACELVVERGEEFRERVASLRDRLWEILAGGVDGIGLNGHPEDRLPNTLNVRFPGVAGAEVLARTPEIAASTGSACKEGGVRPSRVLTAMGLDEDQALGSVRLALGCKTTRQDVDRAAELLVDGWRRATSG